MCHLGLALGKTLQELDQLPEAELDVWRSFYEEQPFGLLRDDIRLGIVAATVANTVVKKPMQAFDFMPFYGKPEEEENRLLEGVVML